MNESGFRPPLCTYRLNWARRTSWGWWDDWDDTVLQTQDSKFEPWRSEAEHATSRSRRLPTILTFTRGWGWKQLKTEKLKNWKLTWSGGSRQRDTTSSGWKCQLNNLAVKGLMFGQCRRRWANINPALVQCFVCARVPLGLATTSAGSASVQTQWCSVRVGQHSNSLAMSITFYLCEKWADHAIS